MSDETSEVGQLIEELLGEQHPELIAGAVLDVIESAHGANPDGWEVTLDKSGSLLRVNAGAILVAEVLRDWTPLRFAVRVSEAARLPAEVEVGESFKILPDTALASVGVGDFERAWPAIREACLPVVAAASASRKRVTWYWAHSQEAVESLAAFVGKSAPVPAYVGAVSGDSLEALFAEFLDDFGSGEKGARHQDIVLRSRADARQRFDRIRELEAAGQDSTDEVLDGLLPHSSTSHNRARGAWISVAPAVTKDIRSWFEGSGFRRPEDWPQVSKAIWRLVSRALARPEGFKEAVDEFQATDLSKGFQAGMISPFLNAIDPERFTIFNSKSRRALNHFAGTDFSPNLASYPEANEKLLAWTKELGDLLVIPEHPDLRPHEAFDMFAHWLVAERKYFDEAPDIGDEPEHPRRIWKIAPGENADHWQEWLSAGIAAIGWNDLGDLSEVSRKEFDARVARAVAANAGKQGWSKVALRQVWRFRNLRKGDVVVANRGTKQVAGIGEVTGGYRFDASSELGHQVGVKWTDTSPREVSKPGWKRTLIELDEVELEGILEAKQEPQTIAPAFGPLAFDLLEALSAEPSKETYLSRKEEYKEHVEAALMRVFREVVIRLPEEIRANLETEKNVCSKFLKNDWGQGGAWPHLWAAAYRGANRIEGAQLFIAIAARGFEAGFFIGHHGNEVRNALASNLERYGEDLRASLMAFWKGSPLLFGQDGEEPELDFGSDGESWWTSLTASGGAAGQAVRVGRRWAPGDVQSLDVRELAEAVAEVFALTYPMILLCDVGDPRPKVKSFLERSGKLPKVVPVVSAPEVPLARVAAETHLPESRLRSWLHAIDRKGQAILYGPPGTGKTFVARKLAAHIIGGGYGFADLLQFHPSYAYEDFIQGLRPVSGPEGGVRFEVIEGRFLEFCKRAERLKDPCVLILDEVNRANLSRVFGELMFLMEYRGESVALAGGRSLRIPRNVRILGTMNTADRSIALVDHALRRRFAFLSLQPEYDVLRVHFESVGFDPGGLIKTLHSVNREIGDDNYSVGVSFFLVDHPERELEHVWRMEIEPYLEELFFDQPQKLKKFRWHELAAEILSSPGGA